MKTGKKCILNRLYKGNDYLRNYKTMGIKFFKSKDKYIKNDKFTKQKANF